MLSDRSDIVKVKWMLDHLGGSCADLSARKGGQEDMRLAFEEIVTGFLRNPSPFSFTINQTLVCGSCSHSHRTSSDTVASCLLLSLPLRDCNTLQLMLKSYFVREVMNDPKSLWRLCPKKCGPSDKTTKTLTLGNLPAVFCVHLQRFAYNTGTGSAKLARAITYPKRVNFGRYTDSQEEVWYDLVCVGRHVGPSIQRGHFIAWVKLQDKQWYVADDKSVQRLPWNDPVDCEYDTPSSQQAYMLFYSRTVGTSSKF